jgi:hypothetical protein
MHTDSLMSDLQSMHTIQQVPKVFFRLTEKSIRFYQPKLLHIKHVAITTCGLSWEANAVLPGNCLGRSRAEKGRHRNPAGQ